MSWSRVTRGRPCPVCGKPSWCTIGERGVCCMRVESTRPARNGGWMHPLDARASEQRRTLPPPARLHNPDALLARWRADTTPALVSTLASDLHVTAGSLRDLGAVWAAAREAWAFPMRDGAGKTVGIRLRAAGGRKWAVSGSCEGLFYDPDLTGPALICEGPTDAAAAMTLGFNAVGRPSCTGGVRQIADLLERREIDRAIIIADDDTPGRRGALRLAEELTMRTKVLAVPAKDLREFVRLGATGRMIREMLKGQNWRTP